MRVLGIVIILFLSGAGTGFAASEPAPGPLAKKFGAIPAAWYMRLSPDGNKISFLRMHEKGFPVLTVFDTTKGEGYVPLGSDPDRADLSWCEWANQERLLCGLRGVTNLRGRLIYETRLVAVNYDGEEMEMLLQDDLRNRFAQLQDQVVDWLVDDPEHVLVQIPDLRDGGTGVARLDIYSGGTDTQERTRREAFEWMSDGYGTPRLYHRIGRDEESWYYRLAGDDDWHELFEADLEDLADFSPVGFGEDRNTLFVIKPHEGRRALFSIDLANEEKEDLVYAHPEVDVEGALRLGKHDRMVAVGYSTDRRRFHFFDDQVGRIVKQVEAVYPDKIAAVVDESWDQRYYLVRVGSDQDPGAYYRLDTQARKLVKIQTVRPELEALDLAPMRPMTYTARDGTEVPAYLTLPVDKEKKNLPTVILPHGGPQARDTWGFDWIVQFLAAKGYAVLQTNFRGSGGFGEEWAGEGGYREWRQTMRDIADGARALVEKGTSDPNRICVAGASYGGYAAMMSAILDPEIYQCIVSIAGVSGLDSLRRERSGFIGSQAMLEFIGDNSEIRDEGSPERRADEIEAPVLLLHGEDDVNVDVDHSEDMKGQLEDAGQEVELIKYEDIDHYFQRGAVRADMLARIGAFLDRHIGGQTESASR